MGKGLLRCLLICLSIGLGFGVALPSAQAQDPFGRSGSEQSITADQTKPGWTQRVFTTIAAYQRAFNRDLRRNIRAARTGDSWTPIWALLGLSFLYGIFHAAGPGHGKMVTTTYFLTHKSNWRAGAMMGSAIAIVQAVSAVLIVGILALVLDFSARWITRQAIWIEIASYGLVLGIGGLMLWRALRGRDACGHRLGDSHDHSHDHDHAHDHTPSERFDRKELGHLMITSAAVGVRPCTGALLLLLFTFANGLAWIGVAGVFAMAFGVAITVTLIGTGAIGLRAGVGLLLPNGLTSFRVQQLVATLGALLIIGLAALLISGAAHRIGGGL